MLPVSTRIFIAAIVFRLFTAFVAFLANVTFPPLQNQGFTMLGRAHPFWDTFARYDAGWYHGIASQGYVFGAGGRNNLAFFPLYPMLMRGGGTLLGSQQQDFYFAGIVVSWIAFACAMVMLYKLARLDLDERRCAARRVIRSRVPLCLLLRRRLLGKRVFSGACLGGVRVPDQTLGMGGACRGGDDRDARDRRDGAARSRVDCVAGNEATRQQRQKPACLAEAARRRSPCGTCGRGMCGRHRALLRLQLHRERLAVCVV